jgi:tetratricopeptide (TPR) repeat protein
MSRNGADRQGRAALVAVVLTAQLGSALAAQEGGGAASLEGIDLSPRVRQVLGQIEEQWLEWAHLNNPEKAEGAVESILATAGQLEMKRLPDLSAGAVARAIEAARKQDFNRARWALEAAEKLDPGRPETELARAAVAWREGSYLSAAGAWLAALPRLPGSPLERSLGLRNLTLWALTVVLLAGGLFLVLMIATKGGGLLLDVAGLFSAKLPRPVAWVAAAATLLWPLLLPRGLLWLLLYWTVLLWGYGSTSERVVLGAVWLVLGLTPIVVAAERRSVELALSPPSQALYGIEQRSLYGALFSDLSVLAAALPDSVAVEHLLADVHRLLGQWEEARALYREVLADEPDNRAVVLNTGCYHFLKKDYGAAIESFRKVVADDPNNVAAHFNLSQAYTESYLFDEAKAAREQGQAVGGDQFSKWIAEKRQIASLPGGLDRIGEVRAQLAASWRARSREAVRGELLRQGLPLLVAVALLLVAVALHLARRHAGYTERPLWNDPDSRALRWVYALVPGLLSCEAGEGGRALAALLLPVALLTIPLSSRIGFPLPWRYDPGDVAIGVAVVGLLIYFGVRLRRELRAEG